MSSMKCPKCGVEHTDYEKDGPAYLPSPDARGGLQPVRCNKCDSVFEVGVR